MRIRQKGVIRLWIVLSLLWVVGGSVAFTISQSHGWSDMNAHFVAECSDRTFRLEGQTIEQCFNEFHLKKSFFEYQGITPLEWWIGAFGIFLAADLMVTAMLIAVFYATRWIVRGFRTEPFDVLARAQDA